MTLRDALTKKKRRAVLIAYAGMGVFAFGMAVSAGQLPWVAVGIAGFVTSAAAILYLMFFLKCPACGGRIGYAISYPGGPFSVSRKIRYCPFCSASLDSDVGKHAV